MAHTGSYATTSFAAFLAEIAWNARTHCRRNTSSVSPASRSSRTSPTQQIGVSPAANAAFKRQRRNQGVTEIEQIPNRGHSLTIDSGWPEAADVALAWLGERGF